MHESLFSFSPRRKGERAKEKESDVPFSAGL